jgi:hypothetical protein
MKITAWDEAKDLRAFDPWTTTTTTAAGLLPPYEELDLAIETAARSFQNEYIDRLPASSRRDSCIFQIIV